MIKKIERKNMVAHGKSRLHMTARTSLIIPATNENTPRYMKTGQTLDEFDHRAVDECLPTNNNNRLIK